MDHRAYVERINIEFEDIIPQSTNFPIQYPVELEPILSASAISAGEQAPVVISFENFSTHGIGIRTKNQRVLRLRIDIADEKHLGPDTDSIPRDQIIIYKENGTVIQDNTFTYEIENLLPKSIDHLKFTVKFKESVEPYSFVVFTVSLDLGHIDNYQQYKCIQQRTFQVQLAESYEYNPKSKTLLIVNNRTVKKEIYGWRSVFDLLKIPFSVYNIALYRGVDALYNRITDGKNLIDDFAGGGVFIFLNNACRDLDSNEERAPFHDFARIYPLQLIKQFKIRILFFGDGHLYTSSIFLPLQQLSYEKDPSLHFKSSDQFLHTGIDRVTYHLLQTTKTEGIFYSEVRSNHGSSPDILLAASSDSASSSSSNESKEERFSKRLSRTQSRKVMSQSLLKQLSSPASLERSNSFLSISPEISVCKAAQVCTDYSGYLMKKRKEHQTVRSKVSTWQKRFFAIRNSDQTLSWYSSATAKNPKGVLDLSEPFTIEVEPVSFSFTFPLKIFYFQIKL